eukprot:6741506-Prymnesium_polylepis.1
MPARQRRGIDDLSDKKAMDRVLGDELVRAGAQCEHRLGDSVGAEQEEASGCYTNAPNRGMPDDVSPVHRVVVDKPHQEQLERY